MKNVSKGEPVKLYDINRSRKNKGGSSSSSHDFHFEGGQESIDLLLSPQRTKKKMARYDSSFKDKDGTFWDSECNFIE